MQEKSLSERQKEILAEIIKFKKENGFSPTVRELCKLVGLKSTSSMAAQLSNLRDSGHITWIESMPRTITVIVVCVSIIVVISVLFAPGRGVLFQIYQRKRNRILYKLEGGDTGVSAD